MTVSDFGTHCSEIVHFGPELFIAMYVAAPGVLPQKFHSYGFRFTLAVVCVLFIFLPSILQNYPKPTLPPLFGLRR